MNLPKVLKNFNLIFDGQGYAGLVEELTLPKLSLKTQEYRAGGMDFPVELDMGMEKLECNFTLSEYRPEVITQFGARNGAAVDLTLRGALDDDSSDNVTAVVVHLSGAWKELDFGNWKAGDKATLKVSVSLRRYTLEVAGEELVHIDASNMIRRIGGEDKLESVRDALGQLS